MNIRDRVGATATPPQASPNPRAVATPACQDKQAMKAVIRVLLGLFALSVCLTLAAPTVSAQPAASSSPSQAVTAFIPVSNLPAWPVLGQGSNSDWPRSTVRSLQYLLNAHGADLVVDGFFGPRTDAAVRLYQRTHGLVRRDRRTQDRVVGDHHRPSGERWASGGGRPGSGQFPRREQGRHCSGR